MTTGIHHITAISSSAQKTYDFYTGILGLRLVKKTVNFDAPNVYHLYFGNEKGEPGTALTFFPFEDAGTGMRGTGQVTKIYFAVAKDALGFWLERFIAKGVRHDNIKKRFDESYLTFYDFDGLALELVATDVSKSLDAWAGDGIPSEKAIHNFYGAELSVDLTETTQDVLVNLLGYEKLARSQFLTRYINRSSEYANIIDLLELNGWPEGRQAAGVNHHIAFRVPDDKSQVELLEKLEKNGLEPTNVIDRFYFKSVYFREPNNVLFEIATDGPGFDADEDLAHLGEALKIPQQYENIRNLILPQLPELHTKTDKSDRDEKQEWNTFKHVFIDNKAKEILLLLHGTGGDEKSMLNILNEDLIKQFNILSVRGNVSENGMNRYFLRNSDGSFVQESVDKELESFKQFLESAKLKYKITDMSALGYSNGANFALIMALSGSVKFKKLVALHPVNAYDLDKSADLSNMSVLVTYGESDPYSTDEEIERLRANLEKAGVSPRFYKHSGGHEVTDEELQEVNEFLQFN